MTTGNQSRVQMMRMINLAVLLTLMAMPSVAADGLVAVEASRPAAIAASQPISSNAGYLVAIEADYRDVREQAWLDQVEVLSIGRDHLVASATGAVLPALPDHLILDRAADGAIDPGNYLSARLRDAFGRDTATRLGTVLLERDGNLLIRRAPEISVDLRPDGLDAVVPLRPLRLPAAVPPPPSAMRNDVIPDIVAAIDQTQYMDTILDLEYFFTRSARTPEFEDACFYAHDKLESYGLTAEIEQFVATPPYGSQFVCWNVVAEKPGMLFPDMSYVICGHLDATAGNPSQPEPEAPGADDDGSGAAAVLEAARVLSAYEFDYTLRFICFGAEEQGLCGSYAYANAAAAAGDDIRGVINLDMLLYGPPPHDSLRIVYDNLSQPLAQTFDSVVSTYVPDLDITLDYNPSHMYSDHYPFWVNGYAAVGGFEEYLHHNPYYHTTGDVLGQYLIYFPFGTNCVRGSIATLAALAQPYTGIGVDDPLADRAPGQTGINIVALSPNPVQETLRVDISSAVDCRVRMTVYDVGGRMVLADALQPLKPGFTQLDLGVEELPNGVYMLQAGGDRTSTTRKLVIAR